MTASEQIDKKIAEYPDWRGRLLADIRRLIRQADPQILEDVKWRGAPTWSHDGLVCTGETYKTHVKITFARGASLRDPSHLFNASLDGNVRRAVDIREGEQIDEAAFISLVQEAVALNQVGIHPT